MQAWGLLNYRLKYCWLKVIYFIRWGAAKNLRGNGPTRLPLSMATNACRLMSFVWCDAPLQDPLLSDVFPCTVIRRSAMFVCHDASYLRLVTLFPLTVRNFWSTNIIIKFKICKLFYFLRAIWMCTNILRFLLHSWGPEQELDHTYKYTYFFISIEFFVKERHAKIIFIGQPRHLF